MVSESKALFGQGVRSSLAYGHVTAAAEAAGQRAAQAWFARERTWVNERHIEFCRIGAPTFFEAERAEWFRREFAAIGWRARLDRAGNVLATLSEYPDDAPRLVVSAHLDTVFAPGRREDVYVAQDGRLIGPGVSDNGSGLSALLALARVLIETRELRPLAARIDLVANVGEEGEGNLNGMRYLCRHTLEDVSIGAFVVIDGPSTDHITAFALASRRFEILFSGPGGHSWNDYGTPNPIHAAGELISYFAQNAEARLASERKTRCSFNFGIVEGGTSINAIPASARTKLDLRSESPAMLDELSQLLSSAVERSLERENRLARGVRLAARIRELGARPGGRLPEEDPLLAAIQAVDTYLDIRSRVDCASTDANVPLSMGLPAISIGAGGQGGGAHTASEWYQPEGRELGLRRILLLLGVMAETATANRNILKTSAGE